MQTGTFVIVKTLETNQEAKKQDSLNFYNTKNLEPIKIEIINKIMALIKKEIEFENIIITGSFLNNGFNFNDIDILLIIKKEQNIKQLENQIKSNMGIKPHIVQLTNTELIHGLQTDPLYQLMISKCISQKKLIYKITNKPIYRILDLHLLKSYPITNYPETLSGEDKYYLIRNMIAIKLFTENVKLTPEIINKEIEKTFGISAENIKKNIIEHSVYKKLTKFYKKLQDKIITRAGREFK